MQQNPSWDDDSYLASEETLRLLRNPKVRYFVHNSPPLVLILSQMHQAHNFPAYNQNDIHDEIKLSLCFN
jgi:hypothetical protein